MASYTLPADHLIAGTEYRDKLRELGLDPEGLLWAYDETLGEFVLVLITTHIDHAGPLALYRLLTRAYTACATPTLIDPFIVRLHSPAQAIVASLHEAYGWRLDRGEFIPDDPTVDPRSVEIDVTVTLQVGDLNFANEWVYRLRENKMPPVERNRRWKRFQQRVEGLALAA